ncbi:S1 family peptidase [Parasalinivibrio latis]|uniref:trypsin-like serine protease n=1 Tax=Parasalinivibrio latis TaxID=2952610 RepID=UPI0030E30A08
MKNTIPVLICWFLTFGTNAVENGNQVNHSDHQYMIQVISGSNCTGQLVSGKYILTAGHCSDNYGTDNSNTSGENRAITGYNNQISVVRNQYIFDDTQANSPLDFAIWELPVPLKVNSTALIADSTLTTTATTVKINGFGSGILTQAITETDWFDPNMDGLIRVLDIGQGTTQAGDSGSGYWGEDGLLYAIHRASNGAGVMNGSSLSYLQGFIQQHINNWNYPTDIELNGTFDVQVQSLFANSVIDQSFVSGDVTIDVAGSSCISSNYISPFEICTYRIRSSGKYGKLHLDQNNFIEFNSDEDSIPPGGDGNVGQIPSGGSGGGSIGFGLLATLLAIALRKYNY